MQISQSQEQNTTSIEYCLYARKSSESDERQAMSIDSQIKEMSALAAKGGLIIKEVLRESHSAKDSGQRPMFMKLLRDIRENRFNGILTWAPDRLSRNAGDLGILVDLMDQGKLHQIKTFSQSFSNNPNEKFLLMILCSQAKLENDNRGINVKRGIRAKCEMGWRPGVAPLGYMNRAFGGNKDIIIDPDRAPIVQEMFHRVAEFGQSGRTLKKWLDRIGLTTKNQKKLTLSMIYYTLKNSFYYGKFKYGDKWYTGLHKPLISEETFNKVQKQLVVPRKSKWGSKGFAFKSCFKCATCNSSIVGEEKYRRRLDGSVRHHIYYHCSRQVNYNCSERYISEEELIQQLIKIISSEEFELMNVNEKVLGMYESYKKIAYEILIQTNLGDENTRITLKSFGIYILRNGSNKEKADFVQGLPINMNLHNRKLQYSNHS